LSDTNQAKAVGEFRYLGNAKRQKYIYDATICLTLYRSYDPYMGHKRFFHCHDEKVGT